MRLSPHRAALTALLCCVAAPDASALLNSAADGVADYASIVELGCNYDYRPGREFQFPSADEVLQPYGYVLWRDRASLVANPLDYVLHQGRRGKLSGETIIRDGVRWYTGVLEDCTRIYAEDASAHSPRDGLEHLVFHGKVFFADTYAVARSLIGHDVIVRGEGLEPRQRLYTRERGRYYALHDEQVLRVVGIDTHRYAHAKGVGPFFLEVENAQAQRGLVKFNPDYLEVPHGSLPIYQQAPGRAFSDTALPARSHAQWLQGNQPLTGEDAYVLKLNRFQRERNGLAAVAELQQAGFEAELMPPQEGDQEWVLLVEGFATERMAMAMARILASRFGWIKLEALEAPAAVAQNARLRP